jgi:hypothetical protein
MSWALRYLFNFIDHGDRDAVFRVCKAWRADYKWVDGECAYILALEHGDVEFAGQLWSFSGPFLSLDAFRYAVRKKQYAVLPQFIAVHNSSKGEIHNLYVTAIRDAIEEYDCKMLRLVLPVASTSTILGYFGRAAYHALENMKKGDRMFAVFCKSVPNLLQLWPKGHRSQSRETIKCFVRYYGFDTVFPFVQDNWQSYICELACECNNVVALKNYKDLAFSSPGHAQQCLRHAIWHNAIDCVAFLVNECGLGLDQIDPSVRKHAGPRVRDFLLRIEAHSDPKKALFISLYDAIVDNKPDAVHTLLQSRLIDTALLSDLLDSDLSISNDFIVDSLVMAAVLRMSKSRPSFSKIGRLLHKRHIPFLLDYFSNDLKSAALEHCSVEFYVELIAKSRRLYE